MCEREREREREREMTSTATINSTHGTKSGKHGLSRSIYYYICYYYICHYYICYYYIFVTIISVTYYICYYYICYKYIAYLPRVASMDSAGAPSKAIAWMLLKSGYWSDVPSLRRISITYSKRTQSIAIDTFYSIRTQ